MEGFENTDKTGIRSGVEHVEITPDSSTGAYYTYDHNRMLILDEQDGDTFFVNIYRQQAPSNVGKRGLVLGPDEDWTYLYSGQKGLSKMGLGWVKTYIYESYGITIFLEEKNSPGRIKCASITWLSAGWSKINMVTSSHIYTGLERFTKGLKAVMEHPSLPEPDRLAAIFQQHSNNSTGQLKQFARKYLSALADRHHPPGDLPNKLYRLVTSQQYIDSLTKQELKALFDLEYTKHIIGKPSLVDIDTFLVQATSQYGNTHASVEN